MWKLRGRNIVEMIQKRLSKNYIMPIKYIIENNNRSKMEFAGCEWSRYIL